MSNLPVPASGTPLAGPVCATGALATPVASALAGELPTLVAEGLQGLPAQQTTAGFSLTNAFQFCTSWRVARRSLPALTAAFLVLSGTAPAVADFYMYKDKGGVLKFTNAPAQPGYKFFMSEAPRLLRLKGFLDPARAKKYDPLIASAAERYKIDKSLIKGVIRAESGFVPHATSPKGAQGLMQLMPATARLHGVVQAYDPEDNIEGGVRHLRLLLDRYGGNVRLALAAYNAGAGAVDKYGGVPPYPETWQYLDRVMSFREHYARQGG